MKRTYSLGSLWGVRLGLNWSVLVLLALVMWMLATSVFPETNPGLSSDAHFAMAVAASLGFFGSILLHELGHALQARRDGMEIDGITLWLFGGVATFTHGFPSAPAELRIAAAGPAVSAGLAGAFVGLWYLPLMPEGAAAVFGWLGLINVALLAFNLLPAIPLDGGRILRAIIWRVRGDFIGATRVAARVAVAVAGVLMVAGLALTLLAGGIGGIWLAFIAWFVLQAARAEGMRAEHARRLPDVAAVMDAAPTTVTPDTSIAELLELAGRPGAPDAYPVMADGRAVGLMMLTDPYGHPAGDPDERVGQRMVPLARLATLAPGDDLVTAVAALHRSPAGHALVLDGEDPVGVLSPACLGRIPTA